MRNGSGRESGGGEAKMGILNGSGRGFGGDGEKMGILNGSGRECGRDGGNQNGKKKILRSHLEMTRHVRAQKAAQVAHQCESTMTKETQMHRKTPYTTKEYVYDNVG